VLGSALAFANGVQKKAGSMAVFALMTNLRYSTNL